jgi:hypothetical protein
VVGNDGAEALGRTQRCTEAPGRTQRRHGLLGVDDGAGSTKIFGGKF